MRRFAVAAALLAAACARTEAPAPAAGEPKPVVVTIGVAGPLTGSIAHQGKDDENGVALAIDQANAKKLVIGGKPVVLRMMSEDDQGDPKLGTLVAQKLVDAKVAAVIGHLNSGVSAFHRWTWESTIIRLRSGCEAICWHPCVASARPAPSALVMKLRRDAMLPPPSVCSCQYCFKRNYQPARAWPLI